MPGPVCSRSHTSGWPSRKHPSLHDLCMPNWANRSRIVGEMKPEVHQPPGQQQQQQEHMSHQGCIQPLYLNDEP